MVLIERDSPLLRKIRAINEDETDDANAIMNGSMTSGNDYDNATTDTNNTTTEDNNAEDEGNTDDTGENNQDNTDDNTNADDEDFSIDTSLDDNGDDDNDSDSSASSSSTYSSENDDSAGVNSANTDIYSSLTAEEQAQKIEELKNQYKDLYTECDQFLIKCNNLDVEGSSILTLSKITKSVYNLKQYIKDYFVNSFPYRSIIQNDIMYNRFLFIFDSLSPILDDMKKSIDSEHKNN